MATGFKPIRPKKVAEEVAGQIKAQIASGELTPGERIPSERELAAVLGVSRPTVREAITALEMMGFVESRHGGGTYVCSLTNLSSLDPLVSLLEDRSPLVMKSLIEARMGLESWSAFLAAKNSTDEEIIAMRNLCLTMESQSKDGGWDTDVDARFHVLVTKSTHNALQMHMLNTIYTFFRTGIMVALSEFFKREGYIELLIKQHRAIVDGIAARDPQRARDAMMAHLQLVEDKMGQLMQNGEF